MFGTMEANRASRRLHIPRETTVAVGSLKPIRVPDADGRVNAN
jgi:hypothetical protein